MFKELMIMMDFKKTGRSIVPFTNAVETWIFTMLLSALMLIAPCRNFENRPDNYAEEGKESAEPTPAQFARMSNFSETHHQALIQTQIARSTLSKGAATGQGKWKFAGPSNISGRITDVVMHPIDTNIIYAASATGGVFKSVDFGKTWIPVFDQQLSLSIGSIAIDPHQPDVIYVGTGEANGGGGSVTYDGTGMYKSTDGGMSWENIGLGKTGSIARIAVHPNRPEQIFAAAMGNLFKNNQERGLYKSKDGGKTWVKTLFISETTGCVDVVVHPNNPDLVFAVMWERVRRPDFRKYGGKNCGIYRSMDAGISWQKLTNGLPQADLGRIGISVSASNPEILYAVFADEQGYFQGIFRTDDSGNQWKRVNDRPLKNIYENYGWWFGAIRVDPQNPDLVFALGLDLYRTENGGKTWQNISTKAVHVDQHALYIHPLNPQLILLGNDGGVCISKNGGDLWESLPGPPVIQFYTCEADLTNSRILYGGTQDNGIMRLVNSLDNEWEILIEGDGFGVLTDPQNPETIYAAYQYGNLLKSEDGGNKFRDATDGISMSDRKIWHTPFVIDPVQSHILYYGANRLYKSLDKAANWFPVSPVLTKNGVNNNLVYGAVSAIAVATSDNQMVYAGTDDGNLWLSANNCQNWKDISVGLPLQWVSSIAVNPDQEQTVYVAFSGFRNTVYLPFLYKSVNAGLTWTNISENLPQTPVNDIIVDPTDTATVFVATDTGVFVKTCKETNWYMLGDNLPPVPVTDLCLHEKDRLLIAATYGRGMFTFSLIDNKWRKLPPKSEN
ncbi:MAG: glycosyl hydrolase [Sphingobacteriales bacterium]|nr:MAG: glycosyl hydrolase [Sphingobacteriales bacterium]